MNRLKRGDISNVQSFIIKNKEIVFVIKKKERSLSPPTNTGRRFQDFFLKNSIENYKGKVKGKKRNASSVTLSLIAILYILLFLRFHGVIKTAFYGVLMGFRKIVRLYYPLLD